MQLLLSDEGLLLSEVTFCFIDLETTGTNPQADRIAEIGAVKTRRGEVLGTLATFVRSGATIPPSITALTGITNAQLRDAPDEAAALVTLAEFSAGSVLVGHNFRFDMGFLNASAERLGMDRFPEDNLDTLRLSRKLLVGETPNHKLETLSSYLRVPTMPTHRALDDALATSGVFHALLERAGTLGATHLDDLFSLPSLNLRAGARRLDATMRLPHRPGVYFFLDDHRSVLYVGKSNDIKSRVRSYFHSEQRRKVPRLLQRTADIGCMTLRCELEAALYEAMLIDALAPPFNATGEFQRTPTYLYVDPTYAVTFGGSRAHAQGPSLRIGPFGTRTRARLASTLLTSNLKEVVLFEHERIAYERLTVIASQVARDGEQAMRDAAAVFNFELAETTRQVALRTVEACLSAYLGHVLAESALEMHHGDHIHQLNRGLLTLDPHHPDALPRLPLPQTLPTSREASRILHQAILHGSLTDADAISELSAAFLAMTEGLRPRPIARARGPRGSS
jgi:DNA polymerase III epsilon subunit family exonuclease